MTRQLRRLIILAAIGAAAAACTPRSSALDPEKIIRYSKGRIALTHASVIDGSGSPARDDQTVVIERDRISAVGPSSEIAIPSGATVIDLRDHTIIPGLVGMHDHLFYAVEGGAQYVSLPRNFAHLYLAAGVTTIRTAGAIDFGADLEMMRDVQSGRDFGPKIHPSSPYFEGTGNIPGAVAHVNHLADQGATSIKAYTSIAHDELAAVIAAAHKRGLTVTGHLCAVGFNDAADLGIDNLEHGLIVDTEFYSRKVADQCPDWGQSLGELSGMPVEAPPIQNLIRHLVDRHVAVTSTLAVFETFGSRTSFFDPRAYAVMNSEATGQYRKALADRASYSPTLGRWDTALGLEMAFEVSFVRAGGLLMAGADPTGWGGVVAGFADNRNIELLVEAGFTVEEAVQIASANGASFLRESQRIGSVLPGRQADLVVLRGPLATNVRAIRDVEVVFKDGVGYDPARILAAEQGKVGRRNWVLWIGMTAGPALVLVMVGLRVLRQRAKRRPLQGLPGRTGLPSKRSPRA
jgi:imidazolonepropionase-like amidohydrolase